MSTIEILKHLRESHGYTMKQVAQASGTSYSAYLKYESGERELGVSAITKLADFYHVSTDYLLGREPQTNPYDLIPIPDADKAIMEQFACLDDTTREIIISAMCKMVDAYRQSGDIEKVERIERTVGDLLDEMERERQAQEKDGA